MKATATRIDSFPPCPLKEGDWVRSPTSGKWWPVMKVRPRRRFPTRWELAEARKEGRKKGPKRVQVGWNVFFEGKVLGGAFSMAFEQMERLGYEVRKRKPRKGCA